MKLIIALFAGLFSFSAFGQDLKNAMKLTTNEQYEEAEQTYKDLLTKEPGNGDVYFFYGQTIIKEYLSDTFTNAVKEFADRAEELFHKGIQQDSLNGLNYVGMGMITLMRTSDTLKADKYFIKAESLIPRRKKQQTPQHVRILTEMGAAQMLGRVNRYNKAIAYLEKAKLIDGLNPLIFITLGDVYMRMNDGPNTMANYNKALVLDNKSPLPKIKIGDIYMRVPNLNAARPYFEEARQIDSTFAPVYRSLGELYTMAGRSDLAKQNYRKFLSLSGNNAPAKVGYARSLFKSKDYTNALAQIEEVLTVDKSRNYLNRMAAYSCYDKKPPEYEKGKKYIEEFFKNARPDQIILKDYTYYGRILYKLSKNDSLQLLLAFDNLNKAYKQDTNDVNLVSEMALDYYFTRWYMKAAEMFNHKVALGKADINDRMYIGKAYYQLGWYGKADTAFSKIITLYPDYIPAYLYDARSFASIEQKTADIGLARPKFEILISKIGNDTVKYSAELVEAYTYMGSYHTFKKPPEYSSAAIWFNKIYALDPKNKQWQIKSLKSLALVRYLEKKYTEARDLYVQVKKLDPKDPDADKAITDLTKAIKAVEAQKLMQQ